MVYLLGCCVFFFQAEDGIRDADVTGVQTCALPISGDLLGEFPPGPGRRAAGAGVDRVRGGDRRVLRGRVDVRPGRPGHAAGAAGTDLTANQPKPMLPIVGEPMMQHILRLLRRHGFTDVVVTVQFLASVIRNFFGDGSDLALSLSYATEEEPYGTAGSVKNAESELADDTFLVISGDAVTDIDLQEVVRFHKDK